MPGTPGPGATVRGPAAPASDGVPRGLTTRHTAAPKGAGTRVAAGAVLVVAAMGVAACGETAPVGAHRAASSAAVQGTPSSTPRVTAGSPAASMAAAPGPGTAPSRRTAPPSASSAAGGAAATADPPLPSGLPSSAPLRVRLGAQCVVPGTEQRLVVETLPDAFVAFDNLYADGRTGATYGGAEAAGRADGTGRFTAVWRVAPGTPAGRVRLDVGVSARTGSAITMRYYRLAARC